MSKYCPRLNKDVVYLTCQECDEKMCKMDLKPSCETCRYKSCETSVFGQTAICCQLTRAMIDENKIKINGCENYNKDLSDQQICFNCKHFLGGGDWGLACSKHYHKLPEPFSQICNDYERNKQE